MKSSKITAVHGVGNMLGHAVIDVTLHPDQRFALAFDDNLTADLVGAIAASGALNLAKKARAKEKVNPPKPIESEQVGFYEQRANQDQIVLAVTVKEGVVVPFSLPRGAIKSMLANLHAIEDQSTPGQAN